MTRGLESHLSSRQAVSSLYLIMLMCKMEELTQVTSKECCNPNV